MVLAVGLVFVIILANLRGDAEPSFEHDFPSGSDMLREIREGQWIRLLKRSIDIRANPVFGQAGR